MKLSMKQFKKSRSIGLPVLLCVVSIAPMMMLAQDDGRDGPPAILVVQREFTKPGRSGLAHEKTEGQFAREIEANKGEGYYFAMTAMSGEDRALFFSGYSSFADWETTTKAMAKHTAMTEALDRINMADGDLLSSADASVWRKRADMSMNTHNLTGARYMQIEQFKLKPGHEAEWEETVKLVMDAYKKGIPEASWVMYEQVYGTGGSAFVVIESLKSMGEIDEHFADGKKFMEAMGKDGMQRLEKLSAECMESQQTNLFAINPRMSRVPDEWKKAEPDFWSPKAMAPAKKMEAKPAQ
jgi:hypothetical protein